MRNPIGLFKGPGQSYLVLGYSVGNKGVFMGSSGRGQEKSRVWTKVRVKQNLYILIKNQFEQNCKRFYCLVLHHSSYNILLIKTKKLFEQDICLLKLLSTKTFVLDPPGLVLLVEVGFEHQKVTGRYWSH